MDFLESVKITKKDVEDLGQKIQLLKSIEAEIQETKEKLRELQEKYDTVSGEDIPAFLNQFGISSLSLNDGSKVTVKEDVFVSIPKSDMEKREKVLAWIEGHGGAAIIKDHITIEAPEQNVRDALAVIGAVYTEKKDIHAQTLKAFFRDLLGMNNNCIQKVSLSDIPEELHLYIKKQTKIK